MTISDLSEAELRLLRLALNRVTEDATWDRTELALEFSENLKFDPHMPLEISGFEIAEIDLVLNRGSRNQEDVLPRVDVGAPSVTRFGDLWILGEHALLCGDALQGESYPRLLGSEKAHVVFAELQNIPELGTASPADLDPVSGAQFESFLKIALGHAASWSRNGGIHLICADWQHLPEVLAVGKEIYSAFENLCVWTKAHPRKPALASLYTPQHELICVFRVGSASISKERRRRRRRTDVWDYGSRNGLHGASKPVAMIADAIRDCSTPGGVILDAGGGCGTTLIAAGQAHRRARVIEPNPALVDLSIERWQRLTGGSARHAESGRPFARNPEAAATPEKRPH